MTHDDYFETERLIAINTFVEEFRGWQDDAPKLSDEVKVVNVTAALYYDQIINSEVPWIISFVKKHKTQDHLVHSEEIFQTL